MKKTWEQRKLGEIATVTKLAGFEFTKYVSYSDVGRALAIRGLNIKNGDFNLHDVKYIDNSNFTKLTRSKLKHGDILFTYVGTIGNSAIVPENVNWYLAPNVCLIRTINNVSGFIGQLIRSNKFQNHEIPKWITTSSQPSLSMKNIRKFLVTLPSNNEQFRIDKFLSLIDTLFSLQQRKLKQLKRLKKAMLQQLLVSKKDRLTPNVRFSDFSGSWKKCKLGEVIQDYIEKTIVENQYPILTSSQQHGIILQNEYFSGSRVSKTGNIGYFILPRGYFAYRNRSDNDTYVFNRNDCIDREIISRFYPVFKPYNADSNFLLIRLNNGLRKELSLASEGTGQHVLSLKNFKNIQTQFPNLEEQHKIGDFISTLNSLIALHQRKANILSNLKKFLLQKLFI